jgi:DNA-binding GntR family transcriptional regulator
VTREVPELTPYAYLSAGEADEERQKGQLTGNATSRMRTMIVTGVLAPGQRIKERELCEALQVSRTPVREAIKTLLQEGLLRSLPNRSAVVTELDPEEVRDLVTVVATIEGLAGELACRAATDAQIAEIAALHHQMTVHQIRNQMAEYFAVNKHFHRHIVQAADNAVLLWIWDMLALRVDRARFSSNLWPQRWPQAIREHQEIVEALIARDADLAARLMRQHVTNGLSLVIEGLAGAAMRSPS